MNIANFFVKNKPIWAKGKAILSTQMALISLLLLFVSSLMLESCSPLQSRVQLFRSPEQEKVYKAGRKKKLSIIRLKEPSKEQAFYRYQLKPGDILKIRVLNIPTELAKEAFGLQSENLHTVSVDGYINVPVIGQIYVQGKTSEDVHRRMIQDLSNYFPQPSVDVTVTNLRIFVMSRKRQIIITLPTERTHLIEALALSGGVPDVDKIQKVKIIRGDPQDPQIIWIDLRDVSVLSAPDLLMQSGDIIYLESREVRTLLEEIQPYTSFVSFLTLITTVFISIRTFGVIK